MYEIIAWYINLNDVGNQQYYQPPVFNISRTIELKKRKKKKKVKSSLETLEWHEKKDIGPVVVRTFLLELMF